MARQGDELRISGSFGELILRPDTKGRSAPHFHSSHAIGVNRSGGGTLFALGKAWPYASGMVVVTNPFDAHWGRPSSDGLDYCLLFPRPQWICGLPALKEAPAAFWFEQPVLDDPILAMRLADAFEMLAREGRDEALAEAVDALFAAYARPADARRVRRLRLSMLNSGALDTDASVADLAAQAGLSRSHFSRQHRRLIGLSPLDHRRQARVAAARSLIEGGARLADAACRAGFADQAHMTRQFRQILGLTPSAYRPLD